MVGFYPVRAAYFYLKRLQDFGLLGRVCRERMGLNISPTPAFSGPTLKVIAST
jgi:hypothetical protein